jgi:hypothetical protein
MNQKMVLFPGVEHFKEAHALKESDSSYTIDIVSENDGKSVHTRVHKSSDEMHTLSSAMESSLRESRSTLLLDQSGRGDFLLGMASLSLFLYGPSVSVLVASKGTDGSTATGIWLLSAGLGYLLPMGITKDATVTPAESILGLNGAVQGYAVGLACSDLAGIHDNSIVALALMGSVTELTVMYSVGGTEGMTQGRAALIANAGISGMLDGFAIGAMFDNSHDFSSGKETGLILGHYAGYALMNALTANKNYTVGNATAIDVLASIGYTAAWLDVNALNTETPLLRDRGAFAAALAGNIAGYYVGNALLKDYRLTSSQGTYVELGTFGGALLGFGIGLIADPQVKSPIVASGLATLGAIGGFAAVLGSMDKENSTSDAGWSVNVNPSALFASVKSNSKSSSPILGVRYQW